MILVTVGTTLAFDELVRFVDCMAERGEIDQPVVCQIGPGRYEPWYCSWFRFKTDIQAELDAASLVIGHGGTGTVTGLLALGKPFVAVANPAAAHGHQSDFLRRLSATTPFLWTDQLEALPGLLKQAKGTVSAPIRGLRLIDDLVDFLKQGNRRNPV